MWSWEGFLGIPPSDSRPDSNQSKRTKQSVRLNSSRGAALPVALAVGSGLQVSALANRALGLNRGKGADGFRSSPSVMSRTTRHDKAAPDCWSEAAL